MSYDDVSAEAANTGVGNNGELCEDGGRDFPRWLLLLEGIFAKIFGILLFMTPSATLLFLARILGLFLLDGGILRIIGIFSNSSS